MRVCGPAPRPSPPPFPILRAKLLLQCSLAERSSFCRPNRLWLRDEISFSHQLLCRPEQRLRAPPSMMQRMDAETSLTRYFTERPMYGEIKKFRRDLGVGVIYAEDGRAYRFEQTAIRNHRDDLEGHEVHFELGGLKARDIIVLAGSPWAAFGGIGL